MTDPLDTSTVPEMLTRWEWFDPPSLTDPVVRRQFNVDELDRMDEDGVLEQCGRLELLDGILFPVGGSDGPLRFNREQFRRMKAAGVLRRGERVELIGGVIYSMNPVGSRHCGTLEFFAERLREALRGRALVRTQSPIELPDHSEPAPDVALVRTRSDYYRRSHPRAGDVLLVVEFMDSSAAYDRGVKQPDYAEAGVPELWLADLRRERFEVHRKPVDGVYSESFVRLKHESASPEAFPDIVLNLAEILT
jgi:Uma2 family endonuclease